jgi:polyhydroxybutyrate depolymerase
MVSFLLTLACSMNSSLGPGDHARSIQVDGIERTYQIHVPPTYDPNKPTPVVFVFHGMGGDAPAIINITGMNPKSDEAGFLVVYPEGSGPASMRTFDAGQHRGQAAVGRPSDVAFVRQLLDHLPTILQIDPDRIYAAGISNGGMLCYRLAAELSDHWAAIASVAGPMACDLTRPNRPIPILHFHGTADRVVPFSGPAKGTPTTIQFHSVEQTIQKWCEFNECGRKPIISNEPNSQADGTKVSRQIYRPQNGTGEIILYVIEGGGHTWPGQPPQFPFAGRSTKDIVANDIIWDFFSQHVRHKSTSAPSTSSSTAESIP